MLGRAQMKPCPSWQEQCQYLIRWHYKIHYRISPTRTFCWADDRRKGGGPSPRMDLFGMETHTSGTAREGEEVKIWRELHSFGAIPDRRSKMGQSVQSKGFRSCILNTSNMKNP